jgi:8-amino-7-oxononanoate synthase
MQDLFGPLQRRLLSTEANDAFRKLRPWPIAESPKSNPTTELINFGSNDYLGLAGEITSQANFYPHGAGASPLICGYTNLHDKLCHLLSQLEETEATVLLPSGYAACSGTIATLPQRGDLILSDQLNHASIIDGCRLSAAEKIVYPHKDAGAVKEILQQRRKNYHQVWIVTEGVFGMDGSLAPLDSLCSLAEQYEAILIVDEAHGTGVLGSDGSGACSHFGVKARVPIRIGTLSKAVGSLGGFVTGPRVVVDYLVNFCRPLIFSTAAPPSVIASAIAGVESIMREPHRRARVCSLAEGVRRRIGIGDPADPNRIIPIVPIIVGDNRKALQIAQAAISAGIFIPAIRPPTVPVGTSRLRISLTARHGDQQVDDLVSFVRTAVT